MPEAVVEFRFVGLRQPLERVQRAGQIARAPMRTLGPAMIAIDRRYIAEEFAGAFFYNPSGGRTRWRATQPFGTRRIPSTPLGGASGRYARAYAGGPGGTSTVTPRTYSIRVNLPGAAMHRGGTASKPRVGQVTSIKPRRILRSGQSAMRMFLGMTYGVWISDDKLRRDGLRIPARPHAARNPRATAEKIELAERVLAGESR